MHTVGINPNNSKLCGAVFRIRILMDLRKLCLLDPEPVPAACKFVPRAKVKAFFKQIITKIDPERRKWQNLLNM
jgi:hypothetical protein